LLSGGRRRQSRADIGMNKIIAFEEKRMFRGCGERV
jgi:hypothetical protein